MIGVRALYRSVLATLAAVALVSVLAPGAASAAMPWWHLGTLSAPAEKAGGESEVVVEATNLGDRVADGRTSPMTVTDTLPADVSVTDDPTTHEPNVYCEGGGGFSGYAEQQEHSSFSLVGQTVTCTYNWPLMPYERLSVAIYVHVAAGAGNGENEATVSGGGAASVASHHPLALEGSSSFGVQNYELTPEEEGGAVDTQAGSHPFQLTTTLALNTQAVPIVGGTGVHRLEALPYALSKDLSFKLPPGMIGNPSAIPKCSSSVFTQQALKRLGFECPDDTVVGVATSIVNTVTFNKAERVPAAVTEPVYNLEPAAGEPAAFGFPTPSAAGVVLHTSVRTGGDYGVTVGTSDITQLLAFVGSQVTFWGDPSDPRHDRQRGTGCLVGGISEGAAREAEYIKTGIESSCPLSETGQPFLIMPTACVEAPRSSVEGDSWSEQGVKPLGEYTFLDGEGDPFRFDGCNRLNFEPSIVVKSDSEQASTPTGLQVDVHVPQDAGLNPAGLAESAVKRIEVALPEGVAVDASGADGLEACSEALVGYLPSQSTPPNELHFTSALPEPLEQGVNFCPDASKVATVKIHTPLLENDLEGSVYLASQDANPFGSLIAMYLVARDPVSGVLVKLAGQVALNESSGQLVARFENPPLPFEDAVLEFFGGSRAPLGNPALCGSYTTTASITPWSGNPPADISSPAFAVTSGPGGGACAEPLAFSPSLTTGSLNLQAGGFTPFTTTMSREDGQQSLQSIQLKLPPGLSGTLTGVALCGEPQANEGTCGAESLVGETTVSVGLGSTPFSVKGGRVYLTGPYQGAPFGLSIVNPAKAGPFDLEQNTPCDCVVVRAKIEVNPLTAALTITSDNTGPHRIPTIIDGIPLQIRHVNVTINRPGFTFNPTNCEPQAITGTLTSAEGASQSLSVPFQVTNCAELQFAPKFAASTTAKTSKVNGASLNVKLTYPNTPPGTQANIHSVKVELPKQLPSRLTTLQKACLASVFEADPAACPPHSIVGTAKAITPILPVPLTGPAYFVSYGSAKFPELVVVLQGYGVTITLHGETFISKTGITSSTFKTIPDVPVGSFELTLPQGPYSALAANANLCTNTTTLNKQVKTHTHGHTHTTTHKIKTTTPLNLQMPTSFTAQNGTTLHQNTKITVTGCPQTKKTNKTNKKKASKANKRKASATARRA
jgi:hypothetical protein